MHMEMTRKALHDPIYRPMYREENAQNPSRPGGEYNKEQHRSHDTIPGADENGKTKHILFLCSNTLNEYKRNA
jgi:hypothetical protein